MTDVRQRVAERLRTIAPIKAERIWGRAKNIPVHDSTTYLDDEDQSSPLKRHSAFDPDSLGPEGNVWAGSPEDVAELLDEAGLLASADVDWLRDHLYNAWVVISNVSGGDWTQQSQEWRESAERWRDDWHGMFKPTGTEVSDDV